MPRLNLETGKENEEFVLWEGIPELEYRGYCLQTDKPNGTEIIVETKKHHRKDYINAVKDQLLYFKNVVFSVVAENGDVEFVDFAAKVLYEDEDVIIADGTQFSKPHLVLNGVNYGYCDYLEMDMEQKFGNIGFKIKPEQVSINPSRESLNWDDKTGKAVREHTVIVGQLAQKLIAEELQETDLITWLKRATAAVGDSSSSNSLVGKLAGLIDKQSLKPVFSPCKSIRYSRDPEKFFDGFELIEVQADTNKHGKLKISRTKVKSWTSFNLPLYIQRDKTSNKREAFLLEVHPKGFLKLKIRDIQAQADEVSAEEYQLMMDLQKDSLRLGAWMERQVLLLKYLEESTESTELESITPPEDQKDPEEEEIKETKIKSMTPAEKREIEQRTIQYYLEYQSWRGSELFGWIKAEPKIKQVIEDKATVIYGFQEDEELLHMVGQMLHVPQTIFKETPELFRKRSEEFFNSEFKLVKVAKSVAKYYVDHIHVKEFILSINSETKHIFMHSKLVNWHTGRKIHAELSRMAFLANFRIFNSSVCDQYEQLVKFHKEHYNVLNPKFFGGDAGLETELNNYADKVINLQLYIEEHKGNAEAIAARARDLFEIPQGEDTFEQATGLNLPVYQLLQEVLEFVRPLEHILNYINVLTKAGSNIPYDLEVEIREILASKNRN